VQAGFFLADVLSGTCYNTYFFRADLEKCHNKKDDKKYPKNNIFIIRNIFLPFRILHGTIKLVIIHFLWF
jgi:hypothetical protein